MGGHDHIRRPGDPAAAPVWLTGEGFGPLVRFRVWRANRQVARRNREAEARLRAIPELWSMMEAYAAASKVTGASFSDYWTLYEEIRRHRPQEVLELGTGISTVVMAWALRENGPLANGTMGRLMSMEDSPDWHATASAAFPEVFADIAEIRLSQKIDGHYKIFRGVQYKGVPPRPYDFVFSDGPDRRSPVNNDKLFNLDLLNVIRASDTPVRGVVDNHYLTFYVLQKVLGTELARYDSGRRLLFVGPATRADVRYLSKENFLPDVRPALATEFRLRLSREKDTGPGGPQGDGKGGAA